MILMEFMTRYSDHPLNFGSWMGFSLPDVFINLIILWVVLQLYFLKNHKHLLKNIRNVFSKKKKETNNLQLMFDSKYKELGPVTFHEIAILILFFVVVTTWFLRKPGFIPGWADLLQHQDEITGAPIGISSATPTLMMVLLLFIIPADPIKDPRGRTLLEWNTVQKTFPWGIILLMGGGFALAHGAKESCLSSVIGSNLEKLGSLPSPVILILLL